ncbi:MAG: hypothetical protein AAGJ35_07000, partial [Myxococcota bacterium]
GKSAPPLRTLQRMLPRQTKVLRDLGLDVADDAEALNQRTVLLRTLANDWTHWLEAENMRLSLLRQCARYPKSDNTRVVAELEQIEAHIQECQALLTQHLQDVEDRVLRIWFPDHLQLLLDQLDEILAEGDDVSLLESSKVLDVTEQRATWLLGLLEPYCVSKFWPTERFDLMIRQLRRLCRRLRAESQERDLQYRMERRFSKKWVSRAENLTLWLIFVVLGLLIVESRWSLSSATRHALMWVDTAICAWFLFEFGTKFVMVKQRALYFRRHFFIDFLPALPFGFMFWLWQSSFPAVHLSAGRAMKFAQASRITRYIRFLRPLVRIFRVTTFLVRASDRLLRKYEPVFNHNVVIFPRPGELEEEATGNEVGQDIQALRERTRKRMRMWFEGVSFGERMAFLQRHIAEAERCLARFGKPKRTYSMLGKGYARTEVSLERLIRMMTTMDSIRAEEFLGRSFIRTAYRILNYLTAPGVRHLPILRRIARGTANLDPASSVAWMIRRIGRRIESLHGLVLWAGDWYGMITGPQMLDRIGMAMVNATLRPARRFLLFGFLFIFVSLLLQAFSISFLQGLSSFLGKFLGASIVLLGVLSLLPLLLGFWFRLIAGETTEWFSKIFEAQFMGRLKQIKNRRRNND